MCIFSFGFASGWFAREQYGFAVVYHLRSSLNFFMF
jgi:hypothetical protein